MNDKLILLFVFFGLLIMFSSFRKNKKKKILFFGDSITQAGAERGGYIGMIENLLQKEEKTDYELIGAGVSGNKIYDLYLRAESDVISRSPDIVVVYVGVNDVWHKRTHGTGTDADKFEQFYRALIFKLQSAHVKVVLCTPAVIGEKKDGANEQDEDLNKYANIIKNIGSSLQLPVCDLRALFRAYIEEYNTENVAYDILTTDGVHLNETGNRLVAEALWEKIASLNK